MFSKLILIGYQNKKGHNQPIRNAVRKAVDLTGLIVSHRNYRINSRICQF